MLNITTLCIINKDQPTYYHKQTDTFTNVDLSIVSSAIVTEYEWEMEEDLCRSDHFPIVIAEANNSNSTADNTIRYNTKKADWSKYRIQSVIDERNYNTITDINALIDNFNNLIIEAADVAMPTINEQFKQKPIPWWNDECKRTHKKRKKLPTPAQTYKKYSG